MTSMKKEILRKLRLNLRFPATLGVRNFGYQINQKFLSLWLVQVPALHHLEDSYKREHGKKNKAKMLAKHIFTLDAEIKILIISIEKSSRNMKLTVYSNCILLFQETRAKKFMSHID